MTSDEVEALAKRLNNRNIPYGWLILADEAAACLRSMAAEIERLRFQLKMANEKLYEGRR